MAKQNGSDSLTEVRDAEVLAAADLADLVEGYEREARRRLIGAVVWTVVGPSALVLLVVAKPDVATVSALAFLVTLLVALLAAMWGKWWFFARSDLDNIRQLASENRILRSPRDG